MSEISGAINNVRRKTTKHCKQLAKKTTKSFFMFDFNEKLCFCCYATSFLCDVKVIAPFIIVAFVVVAVIA